MAGLERRGFIKLPKIGFVVLVRGDAAKIRRIIGTGVERPHAPPYSAEEIRENEIAILTDMHQWIEQCNRDNCCFMVTALSNEMAERVCSVAMLTLLPHIPVVYKISGH